MFLIKIFIILLGCNITSSVVKRKSLWNIMNNKHNLISTYIVLVENSLERSLNGSAIEFYNHTRTRRKKEKYSVRILKLSNA